MSTKDVSEKNNRGFSRELQPRAQRTDVAPPKFFGKPYEKKPSQHINKQFHHEKRDVGQFAMLADRNLSTPRRNQFKEIDKKVKEYDDEFEKNMQSIEMA